MVSLQVIRQSWSNGRYTCSGPPLMVSWWVKYLAKGPSPSSNNHPLKPFESWNAEDDYHFLYYRRPLISPYFPPICYAQIMVSLQVIRQSWSNGRYTCSGPPLMVSWLVKYLAKGPSPSSNNHPLKPFESWNAEDDYHFLYYRRPLISPYFPPICYEASFK